MISNHLNYSTAATKPRLQTVLPTVHINIAWLRDLSISTIITVYVVLAEVLHDDAESRKRHVLYYYYCFILLPMHS